MARAPGLSALFGSGWTRRGARASLRGHLDGVVGSEIHGWAVDDDTFGTPVEVEVAVDGEVVGKALADMDRPDLLKAGIGNGRCAFAVPIPIDDWRDGITHELRVRVEGKDIGGSPRRFAIGALAAGSSAIAARRRPALSAGGSVLGRSGSLDELRKHVAERGRLALMASFQSPGPAPAYLVSYLTALRHLGIAVLLVDTTPGGVTVPPDLAPLTVHRENVGWDFASWITGIDQVRDLLGEVNELILVNDSVFGPLHDLAESWEHPAVRDADFWGLTDSWSISYHLQSYFVVLRRPVLDHPAFWEFLERYPFPQGKRAVIREGEVGLTRTLHDAGLRSAVACSYEMVARAWLDDLPNRLERLRAYPENMAFDLDILSRNTNHLGAGHSLRQALDMANNIRRGVPLNPTHHFWDTLIEGFRFPFIKRELLLVNPAEMALASEVGRVLGEVGYDTEHIRGAARRARDARIMTI